MSVKRYGPNTEWTKEEIETLQKLSKELTSPEIAQILGRSKGSVQGQSYRTGIQLLCDSTSTARGRVAEKHALVILQGAKLITETMYHASFDMSWKGKRINVKSAALKYNKIAKCSYWNFRIRDCWKNCDLFLFLGYLKDRQDGPEKIWLVPSELCEKDSVSMSFSNKGGIYAKYRIEGDINENTCLW